MQPCELRGHMVDTHDSSVDYVLREACHTICFSLGLRRCASSLAARAAANIFTLQLGGEHSVVRSIANRTRVVGTLLGKNNLTWHPKREDITERIAMSCGNKTAQYIHTHSRAHSILIQSRGMWPPSFW